MLLKRFCLIIKNQKFIEFIKVKNKPSKRYFFNLKLNKIFNFKNKNINDGLKEYLIK